MTKKLIKFLMIFFVCFICVSFSSFKKKHGELAVAPISLEPIVKLTENSSCFQFQVSQGDCYETKEWSDCSTFRERAELVDYRFAPINKLVEYKFSIMLPLGYPELGVKQIIGQWHNDVYGPTLSLRHLNGVLWLDLMLEKNRTTKKFPLKNLKPGIWQSFVLKIVWSVDDNGKIELLRNGIKEVNYRGQTLDFNLKKSPYFRFGLYRSHLYRLSRPSWPTQSVFYCDISSSF
jgi:hypothetical protein